MALWKHPWPGSSRPAGNLTSAAIRELEGPGTIKVAGAFYDLSSGMVEFLEETLPPPA
jgi:hypothetical protein